MSRNVLITCINFSFTCLTLYLFVCVSFYQMTCFRCLPMPTRVPLPLSRCVLSPVPRGAQQRHPGAGVRGQLGPAAAADAGAAGGQLGAAAAQHDHRHDRRHRPAQAEPQPGPAGRHRAERAQPHRRHSQEVSEGTLRLRSSAQLLEYYAVITNNT